MKKNFFIDGFYGFKNLGDDYILESILNTLAKVPEFNNVAILVRKNTYNSFQRKIHLTCVEKKRFPLSFFQKLFLIKKSDYYIIGGGGLFPSDKYILILFYYLSIKFAKVFNKKVCIYGIDVVKVEKKSTKRLWKKILKNIAFMITRDKETKAVLSFLDPDLQMKIVTSSDITFCLNDEVDLSEKKNNSILWALASPFSDKELQLEKYKNRYNLLKQSIIRNILNNQNFEHVFLPFYYENDLVFIKDIVSELPSSIKIKILEYNDSLNKRSLFKNRKLCICMRFHSVVFALFERANFVSISYAPKIERLLNSIGLSNRFVMFGVRESDNYGIEVDLDKSFDNLICSGINVYDAKSITPICEELTCMAKQAEKLLLNWITK